MSRNFSIILQTRVSAAVFCIPALPCEQEDAECKLYPNMNHPIVKQKSIYHGIGAKQQRNNALRQRHRNAEHRQAAVCPSTARTPKKPDADMPAYFLLYRIDRPAGKIETATTAAATAKTADVLFVFVYFIATCFVFICQ